jgi:Zn finger protein HypA/HybF involved in hydrogenase expression
MNEELDILNEETKVEEVKELDFLCPNCGEIHQDDVVFLCNTCEAKDMIKKDGNYICPKCLTNGENFMCMSCDSKEVKLKSKI